jgi:hypothetical protein
VVTLQRGAAPSRAALLVAAVQPCSRVACGLAKTQTSPDPIVHPAYASRDVRDEYDAFREAMRDVARLARYERRALSRRKRAIREFVEIKCVKPRLGVV